MIRPLNIKALETGSGIAWEEWLRILADHQQATHAELAKLALGKIIENGQSKSPEWWAQGVAAAFERHIGRRQPGQQSDGSFSVTVSRTFEGDMDAVSAAWIDRVRDVEEFNRVRVDGAPRISQSEKWRYWRAKLADGSRLAANFQTRPGGDKTAMALNHDGIPDSDAVEDWRSFWKEYLAMK